MGESGENKNDGGKEMRIYGDREKEGENLRRCGEIEKKTKEMGRLRE